MKFCILVWIIISSFQAEIFGQKIHLKDEGVDTITIVSYLSSYLFDEKGTTKGRLETLIIGFNNSKSVYYYTSHQKERYTVALNPPKTEKELNKIRRRLYKKVKSKTLNKLILSLNNSQHPTETFSSISQRKLNSLVNKKSLTREAKWYESDWYFKRAYSTKDEIQEVVSNCQNLDTFFLFLEEHYDTMGYKIITDYDNRIEITIKTASSKYRYEGKYPNVGKQPWYDWTKTTHFIQELYIPRSNYNFETNQLLSKILPKNFLNRDTISFKYLVNSYINWYLKRKKIIF